MPKPFLIGIEVEEIAFGSILRKLEGLPGIVALHMDFTKPGAAPKAAKLKPHTNGANGEITTGPRRRGRPPGPMKAFGKTGDEELLTIVRPGKTVSVKEMRAGFIAAGRSPASVSSILHKLTSSGEIVRSGPNAYGRGKRKTAKAKKKKG